MSEANSVAPSARADVRLALAASSFAPGADYRDQEQVAIYAGKDATLIATTGDSRDPLSEERARKLVADPDFKRLVESKTPEAREVLGVGTHIDGQGGVRLPEQMSALTRPGSDGAPDVVIVEHGADRGRALAESLAQSASVQSALSQAVAERSTFDIPPDMAARYTTRVVESPDGSDRRLGMFLAGDRENPSLEIVDDRIIARNEDAETVAALVRLAQHNGWDKIDVQGTPEFAKAVWEAGSRAGLTVSGYEPTFAEAARATREAPEGATEQILSEQDGRSPQGPARVWETKPLSALSHDEQHDATAHAYWSGEMAHDIPPNALIDSELLDYYTRGLGISKAEAPLLVQRYQDAERVRAELNAAQTGPRGPGASSEAERHRDSEELAELFLLGAAEKIAAEPRLANALQAQAAMEQHIAEVFKGDATQIASETRDSRQMISDVLRRGLDVSVREPTPVRQIEPAQTLPDLER